MEADSKSSEFVNSIEIQEKSTSESADDIVDELIKKASLADVSSDEEYLSATEEDDEKELYAINNVIEDNVSEKDDECSNIYSNKNDQEDTEDKEEEIVDEMELRRKEEEALTEEERLDRKEQGQIYKNDGNTAFRDGKFEEAISDYTKALDICPLNFHKDRAIMYSNRAACKMKQEAFQDAIDDSTLAIELHPQYLKAILRRAELYEKTEKLDDALKDYETVVGIDPGHHAARMSGIRLQEEIKERNEKMKTEMMGKLKDLGDLVLRPFGLSTNNFKLQQDPNSGSYSVQFQQSPTGNGS